MTEPLIKNIKEVSNKIEVKLSFPRESIFFQGHFPQHPILPGFVQLQYALKFAKKLTTNPQKLISIKKLKFTKIITPDLEITLFVEKQNDKITFKYCTEDGAYSSGEFIHE